MVISLYYKEELTMKEIAAVLQIGESRVCQIHALAIPRLRAALRSALFDETQIVG
jgi:RNA polymerase sigma factor for flagellar operon FliA